MDYRCLVLAIIKEEALRCGGINHLSSDINEEKKERYDTQH